MNDQYEPRPGYAVCPYCGGAYTGAPLLLGDLARGGVSLASLEWHCGGCAGDWSEIRTPHVTTRYWEPVGATLAVSPG